MNSESDISSSASQAPHPIDIAATSVGGRIELARLLGVTVMAIGNWKIRGVPIERCCAIEKATGAVVTRRDLRPFDYLDHWPELQTTPSDVATTFTHQPQEASNV